MGHLPENGCLTAGRILVNGENVVGLDEPGLRRLRGAAVAMVYQDPAAALNPVMTIGRQLKEALDAHRRLTAATAQARSEEHTSEHQSLMSNSDAVFCLTQKQK